MSIKVAQKYWDKKLRPTYLKYFLILNDLENNICVLPCSLPLINQYLFNKPRMINYTKIRQDNVSKNISFGMFLGKAIRR